MKVLYTTEMTTPYRVDFFNELSRHCNLTVAIERKEAKWRNSEWLKPTETKFNIKYLKSIKIGNKTVFCPSILKILKEQKFDIIVVGGYSTPTGMLLIEYLKIKKIPFILNSDGGLIKKDSKLKYMIKKHFISSARAWLSTGEETNKYLEYYGAKKEHIYRYPFTSIMKKDILKQNVSDEEKDKIKKELGINEKRVIISVGQFIHRKGFDVLIQAIKNISKDVGVYIIGGEPTEEYIKMKEELMLNNLHFIGFKQKEELNKYYKAADVFAFPTREDIWGLVINEAMAFGLPIITTDKCVAGVELVKDKENGYIVPVNDIKKLEEKIVEIIENSDLRIKMSKNNINKIENYTIENMTKKHIEIFKNIK